MQNLEAEHCIIRKHNIAKIGSKILQTQEVSDNIERKRRNYNNLYGKEIS